MQEANHLKDETSPYLLQHAYNPVDWYPWCEKALNKARKENKPIILSIGYSSCHWCHVMERESFENKEIASLMNDHYVCIKVDREERPDVDQIYMDAVQAMGVHGGWPLNVFLTPDQKPFYGGTYFPPQNWSQLLMNVQNAYRDQREKLEESADQFVKAISASEISKFNLHSDKQEVDMIQLDTAFQGFAAKFDLEKGGVKKAPKFPMPNNWLFLLRYHHLTGNHYALQQLRLTLDKMAYGGIYDQIGGGFARYSVDDHWFAPHFEKMLYDNGQLLSLYSEAYQVTGSLLYKEVVYQTIEWLEREMMSPEGGFYSALDADSEGVEGKFYTWTQDELIDLCGDEMPLISAYFNTTSAGNWEKGYNILHRDRSEGELAKQFGIPEKELINKITAFKSAALKKREHRIRPGLDDKILTAWNAICLKAFVDAFEAFDEDHFLDLALKNAEFVVSKLQNAEGLFRTYKKGKSKLEAYLDDYALTIDALTALYQVTFDEKWLIKADELARHTINHFYDQEENLFYYTGDQSEQLVARKKEIFDNVIPSSNSIMANNLFILSKILDNDDYQQKAELMLARIINLVTREVNYLSNWGILMTCMVKPFSEVVISGKKLEEFSRQLNQHYLPNKVVLGTENKSDLPLFRGRGAREKTLIYVCFNKTCKLPVETVREAAEQLRQ